MSRKTIGRRDESGGLNYFERNFSSDLHKVYMKQPPDSLLKETLGSFAN